MHKSFIFPFLAVAVLAGAPQWSSAQPATDAPQVHTIQPGDTLYGLAKRYLNNPQQWPQLARDNPKLVPEHLRPGQIVRLPDASMRALAAAVVQVHGPVQFTRKGKSPSSLAAGETLHEGDALQVPQGSRAALQLPDGVVIDVSENTVVALEHLRVSGLRSAPKSSVRLHLTQGRVDSTVPPRATGSRFEVRTPLAVAGVRGTHFGVAFAPQGKGMTVDVLEGSVALKTAASGDTAMVRTQQGAYLGAGQAKPTLGPLLPAPDLSLIPATVDRASGELNFERVPGAAAYLAVLVRDDTPQAAPAASQTFTAPPWRFAALETGGYALTVRAIDHNGVRGIPARTRLTVAPPTGTQPSSMPPASSNLNSSDGQPVRDGASAPGPEK